MKAAGSVQGAALSAIIVQDEQYKIAESYLITSACIVGATGANTTSSLQYAEYSPGIAVNELATNWFSVLPQ